MKFIIYYIIFSKNSKINIKTFLYFSKIIVIRNFLNLKNNQFKRVKKKCTFIYLKLFLILFNLYLFLIVKFMYELSH